MRYMKICTKCGVAKPTAEFSKRTKSLDGLQAWCKQCNKESKRDWIRSNRDKVKVNIAWPKYRFRPGDFDDIWEEQEGACAICDVFFTEDNKPKVDHDHNTGKVRGLLCNRCNTALGGYEYLLHYEDILLDYLAK
jgi:hypothetical protein